MPTVPAPSLRQQPLPSPQPPRLPRRRGRPLRHHSLPARWRADARPLRRPRSPQRACHGAARGRRVDRADPRPVAGAQGRVRPRWSRRAASAMPPRAESQPRATPRQPITDRDRGRRPNERRVPPARQDQVHPHHRRATTTWQPCACHRPTRRRNATAAARPRAHRLRLPVAGQQRSARQSLRARRPAPPSQRPRALPPRVQHALPLSRARPQPSCGAFRPVPHHRRRPRLPAVQPASRGAAIRVARPRQPCAHPRLPRRHA